MSKYDYVIFDSLDVFETPLDYLTLKEVKELTGLTKNSIHRKFKTNNNIIIVAAIGYSIERFKKEVKQ